MGLQNRITENKYNNIKKAMVSWGKKFETNTELDEAICEEFGIGMSSARNIRLTKNYQAYCERVFRFHGHPAGKGSKGRIVEPSKDAQSREVEDPLTISSIDFGLHLMVASLEEKIEDMASELNMTLFAHLKIIILLNAMTLIAAGTALVVSLVGVLK